MPEHDTVERLLRSDPWRMHVLGLLHSLNLPDAWIVAGFLRCRIWDVLHEHKTPTPPSDIDVVFFDPSRPPEEDQAIESTLFELDPDCPWEVYNQAHMHTYNGDAPYTSTADSFSRWAESVSTIGVRLDRSGHLELAAPHGLEDLIHMRIRPTPHPDANRQIFFERLCTKGWLVRWPRARLIIG